MYCKECGKELDAQAKVCENCGKLTRKGIVFKSIQKKILITSGIVLSIFVCYCVLLFSGTIDNIKSKIAQNKLEKELKSNAKDFLENYSGNAVSVGTDKVSGEIVYVDQDIYIVNTNSPSGNYMFYRRDGQVYKSVQFNEFISVDNELPLYEQYINMLDEIVDSMELAEYNDALVKFEGTIDDTADVLVNYNAFLSLFDIQPIESDNITFNLTVSKEVPEEMVIDFNINNDSYRVELSDTEEDPKEIIKDEILSRANPLSEAVCYDSETNVSKLSSKG